MRQKQGVVRSLVYKLDLLVLAVWPNFRRFLLALRFFFLAAFLSILFFAVSRPAALPPSPKAGTPWMQPKTQMRNVQQIVTGVQEDLSPTTK